MRTETLEYGAYGVVVALLGLLVWSGLENKNAKWTLGPAGTSKQQNAQWKKLRDRLKSEGESKQPDDKQWRYTTRLLPWWQKIETANWVGKVPKVEVEPDTVDPERAKTPATQDPISDLIELRTILAGDKIARIKIQYKRDVQSPDAATLVGDGSSGPATSALGMPFHDLKAGDSLWPPYDPIRFEAVEWEGDQVVAVFSRPTPDGKGERKRESLAMAELGLSEDHIAKDVIKKIGGRAKTAASAVKRNDRPWKNPGDLTQQVSENVWMVSQKDSDAIGRDYQKIMVDDFQLDDYQSRRKDKKGNRLRGVGIKKVSKSVARFGIRAGDVLIAINGEPVTSRASAIKVGKAQHKRGVRNFDLTFISSGGKKVVRSYRAPDK